MRNFVSALITAVFGEIYVFRHDLGMTHAVRARNPESARRKMRSFVISQMSGEFAFVYSPEAVDRVMEKTRLVGENSASETARG